MPVLLYHARLLGPGGFIGVDVFFVISGYLITQILEGEFLRGSFSLVTFYRRRIQRIVPALFVMLAVSSAFALVLLLPNELVAYGRSLRAAADFTANIFFRKQAGYFDLTSEQKPLLHVWSLGVEGQFYLFWPLILVVLNAVVRGKRRLLVFAALLVLSLAYSEYLVHLRPKTSFYSLPSRGWEFLMGALLASPALRGWLERAPRFAADAASIVGVVLIGWAVVRYDSITPFPGLTALAPCLGAALVIAAGERHPTLAGRLLSSLPLAFVGRMSYSLYLWHWPLLVFAPLYLGRDLRLDEKGGVLALSAAAAYLSWRFVEEPFRKSTTFAGSGPVWIGGSAVAASILVGASALMVAFDGFPGRVPAIREIAKVRSEAAALQASPCLARGASLPPVERCLLGKPPPGARYGVVLWGDSHAAQLAPALDALGQRMGFTARQMTKAGCAPLPGMRIFPVDEMRLECPDFNRAVMETIVPDRPQIVVVGAWWQWFATGEMLAAPGPARPSAIESRRHVVSALRDTVRVLTRAGHRVIVVAQTPIPNGNLINCIERARLIGRTSECVAMRSLRAETDRRVSELLRGAVEAEPDVRIVFPFESLCGARECPIFTEGGNLVYLDDQHLSSAGAQLLNPDLEKSIVAFGRQHQGAAR